MVTNASTMRASDLVPGIIDHTVYVFFLTFNLAISAELIGLFGILGNVINILNFAKQGLNDTVNVTLATLAVSDIGSLLLKLMINILLSPFWGDEGLPFSLSAITLMFFFPQGYFLRVSGYITAYAAFERCLCVLLPLKVKTIISRKVAVVANCGICIVLLMYLFPVYYASYIDYGYVPRTNRTVLTLCYRSNAALVYKVNYFFNDLALPYISFLILILCTSFIITTLKSKAKWRHSVTARGISQMTTKSEFISSKEKKTVVMLTTVSVIYVACMTPFCAMLTAVGLVPELNADGVYFHLTMLVYSFTSLLETINCSVNTIVYYKMSSKYREVIHNWFPYFRNQT